MGLPTMVGTILRAWSLDLDAWVCLPFSGLVTSSRGWIPPVFTNAGFRWVFENISVLVLEVDHIDRRVKLVLRQWVMGHRPPLAAFLISLGGGFLFQNQPSVWRGPLCHLRGRGLCQHCCYRGRCLGCFLAAFQYPEYPFRLGLDVYHIVRKVQE
ncbi:hypothetical protein PanWU01x14_258440 [Parasponia andersonii]|uniref:Uncharacterized protein n=1 Tax=Parasponia andersonii TaxID=3476 RepID=A0A2P5B9M8_PARAD|nr:hypothetical protein PanWU01x14_258440 [Parasponia andersonii]